MSGAGADANNVILTGTHAYVENSAVSSSGKVDIDASNDASIDATIVSVSVGVGGGLVGVGVSIGVAVARNSIGWSTDDAATSNYRTGYVQGDPSTSPSRITAGQTVKITAGANAGNVYEYIGKETLPGQWARVSEPERGGTEDPDKTTTG